MIYEERRVVLRRGALPDYRQIHLDRAWPALRSVGARPLCLLSGLIGLPAEETYSFTGYRDIATWEDLQQDAVGAASREALAERAGLIVEESVRLLRPSDERPNPETPATDRRAVYGMRRFSIRPEDWPDFLRYSAAGVWVRIEAQDARILGLFRDAATTNPLGVTLLTGYHGAAHWEATRGWRERPAAIAPDLWELGARAASARNAITLSTHVCLMNAHWPEDS